MIIKVISLIIINIIVIFLSFIFGDFVNLHSRLITFYSVLIAIDIFLVTWLINLFNHNNNQNSLLRSLRFKIKEIEEMTDSYRKTPLPFYPLPIIEEAFYYRNLDFKINGKSTSKLKFHVNRIHDKCVIINLMMENIQKSWNKFLESNKVIITDLSEDNIKKKFQEYSKTDKIFNFYHPKILSIINDCNDKKGLPYSINLGNFILSESFKI